MKEEKRMNKTRWYSPSLTIKSVKNAEEAQKSRDFFYFQKQKEKTIT